MPAVTAQELGELLDRHAAVLELYASQWTATPEDCVQEAFIELARQRELPAYAVAWLYRVVRNRALNAARAARRRKHYEQNTAVGRQYEESPCLGSLTEKSLGEALSALTTLDREIVLLRIYGGLTWQQIAGVAQTSSSSAQRRYVAALSTLRRLLEPSCENNSTYHLS